MVPFQCVGQFNRQRTFGSEEYHCDSTPVERGFYLEIFPEVGLEMYLIYRVHVSRGQPILSVVFCAHRSSVSYQIL